MAINPSVSFSGRITAPTGAYPYGSAKNETSPGANDGTPYNLTRADDIFGLQQALLKAAGITPSGNAEEVGDSEYLQAIVEEAMGRAVYVIEGAGSAADAYVLDPATDNEIARSYFENMELAFTPAAANTGATTVAPFGLTAADVRDVRGNALVGGEIRTDALNRIRYDAVNGWFVLLRPADIGDQAIQPIDASVASNALTLTLNPTVLDFRDSSLTSGAVNTRVVPSAISVTVSSGSTLGTVNGVAARLAVLAIDNSGTVELAVVNLAGGNNLDETTLISTTAEGGAGGADSNNVIYSTTARANVPFRVVGFIDITEATAGTWATGPTTIQGAGGNAITAMQSIGYGQTWQDVSASRSEGVTYTNTTGRPIMICVTGSSGAGNPLFLVDGLTVCRLDNTSDEQLVNMIVPPGSTYLAQAGFLAGTVVWVELR